MRFYVDPLEYDPILYHDIQFKTGDVILLREARSVHNFIGGNTFTHCGVVVVFGDGIPYIVELSYPCVFVTRLDERFLGSDAVTYYVKRLKYKLNETMLQRKIPKIMEQCKKIKYTNRLGHYYVMNKFSTIDTLNHMTESGDESVCSTFVMWFLTQLGIIHDTSVRPGSNTVTWLDQMGDEFGYEKTKRIKFFVGSAAMRVTDYVDGMFETIKNIATRPMTSQVMLRSVTMR